MMRGVGAFMTMFWIGVVVGYELGLGCAPLLVKGLLSGCIATVGLCVSFSSATAARGWLSARGDASQRDGGAGFQTSSPWHS